MIEVSYLAGLIRLSDFVVAILIVWSTYQGLDAEERKSVVPAVGTVTTSSSKIPLFRDASFQLDVMLQRLRRSRIDLPVRPRVTHSYRPLRQISLLNGDRFVAEFLEWGTKTAAFRLLNGQTITVPASAISQLASVTGEVDVHFESFETERTDQLKSELDGKLDDTHAASGRSSLRIDSTSPGYRYTLDPPLDFARIEFSFQIAIHDSSSASGEWQIEWDDNLKHRKPLVIRIGPEQSISISGLSRGTESVSQNLKSSYGWHSFIALIDPERVRLFVDDALVASSVTPAVSIKSIRYGPVDHNAKNILWTDDLQILKLLSTDDLKRSFSPLLDRDMLTTETGDELFGRIVGLTGSSVTLETVGQLRSIPLSRITSINWNQSHAAIKQAISMTSGIVATVEMQPFFDRRECQPEKWTVTVTKIDAQYLIAQHSLVGELKLKWSDVRRVEPLFVGQTHLVDARRFHLGNSIRSDFHRHLPDGTEIRGDFDLQKIPAGKPYFSLDVAEFEAASYDAPPATPFLAQLRAGNLITEVFVNDQNIGHLNRQIRFKAGAQTPDRIRLKVPCEVLKQGQNSFRLQQQPLEPNSHEFDDGEIGNIRLEFVEEK